jgi:hypothetical protein
MVLFARHEQPLRTKWYIVTMFMPCSWLPAKEDGPENQTRKDLAAVGGRICNRCDAEQREKRMRWKRTLSPQLRCLVRKS